MKKAPFKIPQKLLKNNNGPVDTKFEICIISVLETFVFCYKEVNMNVNIMKNIIKAIIVILFVVGIICLLVGIDDDDALIAGCVITGTAMVLWINYALATYFYYVATEKGYDEACYLWIPFAFTFVGYILVSALPDRKNKEKSNAKTTNNANSYAEIAKYKELFDLQIITQEEFDKIKKELLEI